MKKMRPHIFYALITELGLTAPWLCHLTRQGAVKQKAELRQRNEFKYRIAELHVRELPKPKRRETNT